MVEHMTFAPGGFEVGVPAVCQSSTIGW